MKKEEATYCPVNAEDQLPWPDPLLGQIAELIKNCSASNNQCVDCPELRPCGMTWSRLREISGVRTLSQRDFNTFHRRFRKILRTV